MCPTSAAGGILLECWIHDVLLSTSLYCYQSPPCCGCCCCCYHRCKTVDEWICMFCGAAIEISYSDLRQVDARTQRSRPQDLWCGAVSRWRQGNWRFPANTRASNVITLLLLCQVMDATGICLLDDVSSRCWQCIFWRFYHVALLQWYRWVLSVWYRSLDSQHLHNLTLW